jgi:hypothetical protein
VLVTLPSVVKMMQGKVLTLAGDVVVGDRVTARGGASSPGEIMFFEIHISRAELDE